MRSIEGECSTPNRPWMFGKVNAKQWILVRPDCGLWSCPHCAEKMARRWIVRIKIAAQMWKKQGLPVSFITLTSHRKLKTRDATIKVLPSAWNKLQNRARRANEYDFFYALVPEQHQDGRVHMHLLATSSLSERWYKDTCASCGLGYQTKVIAVENEGQAAGYIAKYLLKASQDEVAKNFRRVRTSQNFPEVSVEETDDAILVELWICAPTPEKFQAQIAYLEREHCKLVNRSTGEVMF